MQTNSLNVENVEWRNGGGGGGGGGISIIPLTVA